MLELKDISYDVEDGQEEKGILQTNPLLSGHAWVSVLPFSSRCVLKG